MAQAFAWAADHGADVISCSFGHDGRPWVLPDIVRAAIDYAAESGRGGKGCVIVWASGNGNELVSTDEWASYEKVIAVGASTDEDVRAPYSDFGPELDVCAPSSGCRQQRHHHGERRVHEHVRWHVVGRPLVAGVAGLLLSANPNLRWHEVRHLLRQSADRIDQVRGDYGADGHSDWYGYGRVNALRALQAIDALAEAVRDLDLEPRVDLIRLFAKQYLGSRPAGRAILEYLKEKKYRILQLMTSEDDFRTNVRKTLQAVASAQESLRSHRTVTVDRSAWSAIEQVAERLLGTHSADLSGRETASSNERSL